MRRFYKRRHRQIARLIYYFCCVRYMTKENGIWVKDKHIWEFMEGEKE